MQLKELLVEVDSLKAEIDKLRPLKPEIEQRIMKKFRLDWNYHSNAIEGNSLTPGETRAFLLEGLTANGKPMKDHLDIKGHDDLITFLQSYVQKKEPLTEADIRGMHEILLKEPYETDAITNDGRIVKRKVRLGEYKTEPNAVRMGSGEILQYAAPQDVGPKMAELVAWHREAEAKNDPHPLIRAALFHHRFASIHPFDDGNGRMARILMNLILMRAGFPPVVIKLKDRDPYVAALRRADAGETEGIVSFIGQNLLDAENLYLRGAKGEAIEDADDVDKEVALLKQELKGAVAPTALTWLVQQDHFRQQMVPFLKRLDVKLSQFDELFARSSATLMYQLLSLEGGIGQPTGSQGTRNEVATRLLAIGMPGDIVINFRMIYLWERFLRQGLNDFSISFEFQVFYEEGKMKFSSDFITMNRTFLYGMWYSEDEIAGLLQLISKTVLNMIQQNRSRQKT